MFYFDICWQIVKVLKQPENKEFWFLGKPQILSHFGIIEVILMSVFGLKWSVVL